MEPFDLIGRGRRTCWKWLHRMDHSWRGPHDAWNPFGQLADLPSLSEVRRFANAEDYWGAAGTLKRHITERLPGRFFASLGHPELAGLCERMFPAERLSIVAEAEQLCEGRFDLLEHRRLTFGDPPDWHLDPITRRRAPLVHWSLFDRWDEPVIGRRDVVWELNRHQWLVTLGQAYRMTGERRFAECFDRSVRDWIRLNPFGLGINWSNTAEVALRLIAWCWALALFLPCSVLTADLFTLLLDHIRLHALYIERYRSLRACLDPTEALGLLYAGLLFPELRRAARWRRLGMRLLEAHILRRISEEGAHGAGSTGEARFTVEACLHGLLLTERSGAQVSAVCRDRLQRLLNCLLRLRRPDGLMNHLGHRQTGWVLPLCRRDVQDWQGLFAVAGSYFRNPQYVWAAGERRVELLWLLGPAGLARFDGILPRPPDGPPSAAAEEAGFVQMRSGWDQRSHQLVFDVGPPPHTASGAERRVGRRDRLGIQCSAFGAPILLDHTPPSAGDDYAWPTCVLPDSHSTVVVDGVPQQPFDHFYLRPRQPRAAFRQWTSNDRFELADADHDGYRRLAKPVIHRRRVLFVKREFWVLLDDLLGTGRHRIELRFHLATRSADLAASLRARVWTIQGPGLAILPLSSGSFRAEIRDGAIATHASRNRQPRGPLVLAYSAEVDMPFRVATHVFPVMNKEAVIPTATALFDEWGALSGSVIDHPPATIMYSDRSVTVETG